MIMSAKHLNVDASITPIGIRSGRPNTNIAEVANELALLIFI